MTYQNKKISNELIYKFAKSNYIKILFTCITFFLWILFGVIFFIFQYLYDKNPTKFWYFSLSNIPDPYTHEYHINRGCPISLFLIVSIIFFIIFFIMSVCSCVSLITSKSPMYIFNLANQIAVSEKRRNVSSKKNTQIETTSSTNLEQAILQSATRRIVAEELNRTNPLTDSINDIITAETAKTILKKAKNK